MKTEIIANKFYVNLVSKLLKEYNLNRVRFITVDLVDQSEIPGCDAQVIKVLKNCYLIKVSKKTKVSKTRCIIHEMTHVKQWETKTLEMIDGIWYWKGQGYNTSEMDYLELPWEIEALKMEGVLSKKFKTKKT